MIKLDNFSSLLVCGSIGRACDIWNISKNWRVIRGMHHAGDKHLLGAGIGLNRVRSALIDLAFVV